MTSPKVAGEHQDNPLESQTDAIKLQAVTMTQGMSRERAHRQPNSEAQAMNMPANAYPNPQL